MWQPDIKFDTGSYPAGGVAPSSYALALDNYIQKARRYRAWGQRQANPPVGRRD